MRELQAALNSRVLIEQAKGVLVERTGVTLDTAFEILRHRARDQRRSLAEICAECVPASRRAESRPLVADAHADGSRGGQEPEAPGFSERVPPRHLRKVGG